MHVAQIGFAYDEGLTDPDALLERYRTLTGWSDALVGAGASKVTVVHRFHRDAELTRNGVQYIFRCDGGGPRPRHWTWPRPLLGEVVEAVPDVAHVNGLNVPVQTWLLRRALGARPAIVLQDHAATAPTLLVGGVRPWLRRAVYRTGLRAAEGFLFTAAELARPWQQLGLIDPGQRIGQVNAGSTSFRSIPRARARQRSGITGEPAVLWVGRLNANKDPLTVLEGFERGVTHLPNAILTMIYSADDLLPLVQARLRASPVLARQVRLVGAVAHDRLPSFYSGADIFVLGSRHEACGFALIEACACGAIPVVPNIPAFRVITANGSVGALWAPGDAGAFARALVAVGRQDLSNLRARVVDHFECALSWAAVGRQAMAAYVDVLSLKQRMVD